MGQGWGMSEEQSGWQESEVGGCKQAKAVIRPFQRGRTELEALEQKHVDLQVLPGACRKVVRGVSKS